MRIQFKGKEVEAIDMEFLTRKEDWNEYQLTDGKILRMKCVVSDIVKIEAEKDSEGNPIYQVKSTNIVRVK